MSQATDRLAAIATRRAAGERRGIASICSAHPLVIEAALRHGKARDADVLIEATCNQVNHEGGYTGMTPGDFRRFVETIAGKVAFPLDRLVLGGDHLGPNPWKHLPAPEAMAKASRMVDAYAEAGFTKIHLDASMGCAGEGAAPPDATIAARAAELAAVAEAARLVAPGGRLLVVDFAPHHEEVLRDKHAHRRLGFSEEEILGLLAQAGLETVLHRELAPDAKEGAKLTVSLWLARDPRVIADPIPASSYETA